MFEKVGFVVIRENIVVRKGIEILNSKMELINNMAEPSGATDVPPIN
jgi:hypothetical protein